METLLYVVKWISITQAVLILAFIILMYASRLYLKYTEKHQEKRKIQIQSMLNNCLENLSLLTQPKINKELRSAINLVLAIIPELEPSKNFAALSQELSTYVLKPKARELACSYFWFNRYLATQCYLYGFDAQDTELLKKLIQEKIALISVNAAKVGTKYLNSQLVNEMITVFSGQRRLRQSLFSELILENQQNTSTIANIIEARLKEETNLYVKIFCYHLLSNLPPQTKMMANVQEDIKIDSKDLKIAILNSVSHFDENIKKEIIFSCINDSHWEVIAVAAKMLGSIEDEQSIRVLRQLLSHSAWWVRINAAHALGNKGPKGIDVLKAQSQEQDKFAFDTATEVLTHLKIKTKN